MIDLNRQQRIIKIQYEFAHIRIKHPSSLKNIVSVKEDLIPVKSCNNKYNLYKIKDEEDVLIITFKQPIDVMHTRDIIDLLDDINKYSPTVELNEIPNTVYYIVQYLCSNGISDEWTEDAMKEVNVWLESDVKPTEIISTDEIKDLFGL